LESEAVALKRAGRALVRQEVMVEANVEEAMALAGTALGVGARMAREKLG